MNQNLNNLEKHSPQAYWLEGSDPFLNLSIEDWLLRTPIQSPTLLLWCNSPCVVIGRGQNPWQEANLAYLEQEKMPLVRRQTGGGTVYHDLGNLNISLLNPGPTLDRKTLITLLMHALENLELPSLESNDRGDIKIQGKKIVGSAYRVTQTATLHHVSLLFDANLDQLKQALSVNHQITGRSVPSVRSEVTTLKHMKLNLNLEQIKIAIQNAFYQQFSSHPSPIMTLDAQALYLQETSIQNTCTEYQGWAWRFGKTPPFQADWHDPESQSTLNIQVEHGLVTSVAAPELTVTKRQALEELCGKPYRSSLTARVTRGYF